MSTRPFYWSIVLDLEVLFIFKCWILHRIHPRDSWHWQRVSFTLECNDSDRDYLIRITRHRTIGWGWVSEQPVYWFLLWLLLISDGVSTYGWNAPTTSTSPSVLRWYANGHSYDLGRYHDHGHALHSNGHHGKWDEIHVRTPQIQPWAPSTRYLNSLTGTLIHKNVHNSCTISLFLKENGRPITRRAPILVMVNNRALKSSTKRILHSRDQSTPYPTF